MKKLQLLVIVMVVVLSVFALAGCEQPADNTTDTEDTAATADTSLQAVVDSGVLRVGTCAPNILRLKALTKTIPSSVLTPASAAAIAEEMGISVECINTPWEGLIAGLDNGDFDIIMSAMSPEEATAATDAVELSENYYVLSDVIVVSADNTDINSKEDLAGKIVGVQDACSAANAAEDLPNQGTK